MDIRIRGISMLSVNDILSKKFEKAAVGGYRVDEVNLFLNDIYEFVNSLLDEKEELEEKMAVLADRLEEYRSDEDSLRAALIGAQKLGDSVVKEAKAKAELIIGEATANAETLLADAQRNIQRETVALAQIQREVASFKNKLLVLYKAHIELIDKLPEEEIELQGSYRPYQPQPRQQETEDEGYSAKEDSSVQQEDIEEPADTGYDDEPAYDYGEEAVPEAPASYKDEDSSSATKNYSSRFGMLQFGEGFDLHRDE